MKMMVFSIHFSAIVFCLDTFSFDMIHCKETLYFFWTPLESHFIVFEKNSKWVTVDGKQYLEINSMYVWV